MPFIVIGKSWGHNKYSFIREQTTWPGKEEIVEVNSSMKVIEVNYGMLPNSGYGRSSFVWQNTVSAQKGVVTSVSGSRWEGNETMGALYAFILLLSLSILLFLR